MKTFIFLLTIFSLINISCVLSPENQTNNINVLDTLKTLNIQDSTGTISGTIYGAYIRDGWYYIETIYYDFTHEDNIIENQQTLNGQISEFFDKIPVGTHKIIIIPAYSGFLTKEIKNVEINANENTSLGNIFIEDIWPDICIEENGVHYEDRLLGVQEVNTRYYGEDVPCAYMDSDSAYMILDMGDPIRDCMTDDFCVVANNFNGDVYVYGSNNLVSWSMMKIIDNRYFGYDIDNRYFYIYDFDIGISGYESVRYLKIINTSDEPVRISSIQRKPDNYIY